MLRFLTELGIELGMDIEQVLRKPPEWRAHYSALYQIKNKEAQKAASQ